MNRSPALFAAGSVLLFCGLSASIHAQKATVRHSAAVSTPAPGSLERKAIMDALRVPVERSYHARVVFVVSRLKVGAGYAYVDAAAQGPDGKPPAGLAEMGGSLSALLRKQGGRWQVLKWGSYGGTDLIVECRKKYPHAPASLFPGG